MSSQVFDLPDLGEGLTEAVLVRWLVKTGDAVAVDEPVAEVETAKAMVEVPSPFGGVVARLHGEEGATLQVGSPLISVDAARLETYAEEERAGSGNVLIGYGTSEATTSRRRRKAVPRSAARPSARIEERSSVRPPARNGERPAVQSPIVRRLARDNGVDLQSLTGTGPDGLITRRDVEAAFAAPAVVASDVDQRTGLPIRTRVPLTGMRKAVATTLTRSRTEIPEATTWVDVDATALLELRAELKESGAAPGILAMVARFVVAGLARFPELNSRVDTERGEITHLDGVNLGLAAQTERGLVVPAIKDAHRLSMRGLDTEIRRLTAAAREGTATAAELSSGSFTLNNYGVLGVDGSAAIINHPEVAILGMGRILPRPWVVGGDIVARHIVQLSLVFDHRVCDGGTAGGFLRFVADCVEAPVSAMADL
ncbi:dihydrolipoamide acetyltransferase family protein [Lentzea flaviverrucosa]|uniref:Dihydrolipoamide acetyltransferase component of pyruvate dehydrogenase complex n=1 Tax=Lentzea flaviverrucosa TaxID=200379 RepID=A0A1H9XEK9_9PSEU|nr:dihydrolipoamide acetyltransferase family protein [Lentzea flaviverrucosa]RDI21494.1 pyruvate dehydrogenase E2 component (dihydrolipoamide acetyltransferase) [Lentzea flaviverrucosa]SES44575.1 pyruvate dehydrogenase E2 component (dihydrolipoamide acetyltransferase) [Lentzea flaviverrucosa]